MRAVLGGIYIHIIAVTRMTAWPFGYDSVMRVRRSILVFLCLLPLLTISLTPSQAASRGDRRALRLFGHVVEATRSVHVLLANFSYVVTDADGIRGDVGIAELMKPNYAVIAFNKNMKTEEAIISDGTTVWTYRPAVHQYKKTPADPGGKNVNLWRVIPINGFFDLPAWLQSGLNLSDMNELTYAGNETVNGIVYQVLERKTMGVIQKQVCPLDQKLYVGSDNLIHRTTITYTLNGMPGSEVAELTDLKIDPKMGPIDFSFTPPPDASLTRRFNAPK